MVAEPPGVRLAAILVVAVVGVAGALAQSPSPPPVDSGTTDLTVARKLIDAGHAADAVEKLRAATMPGGTDPRVVALLGVAYLSRRGMRRTRSQRSKRFCRSSRLRRRAQRGRPSPRARPLSRRPHRRIDSLPRRNTRGRAGRHQAGLRAGDGVRADSSADQGAGIHRADVSSCARFGGRAPAHRADDEPAGARGPRGGGAQRGGASRFEAARSPLPARPDCDLQIAPRRRGSPCSSRSSRSTRPTQ